MKKIILIIIITIFSINAVDASELNCTNINNEIENYSNYRLKIDNLFIKLNKKSENIRGRYYTKLNNTTSKYLSKLDKIKQKKYYTIVGYISCENRKLGQQILKQNIENKYDISITNKNTYKESYRLGGNTELFSTHGEGIENIKYFELTLKYKCELKEIRVINNVYLASNKSVQKVKLNYKGTIKKGENCSARYYVNNIKLTMKSKYNLSIGSYNPKIFKRRNIKLNFFISKVEGSLSFDKKNPYLVKNIYDDKLEKFGFNGLYTNTIFDIEEDVSKIGKINVVTYEKNYKIHSLKLGFNIKKDGKKLLDNSLLGQIYIIDNFGKKYVMKKEDSSLSEISSSGSSYLINREFLDNYSYRVNKNITSFSIYADISRLKKYSNNKIGIETFLNYTSVDKDGFIFTKGKRSNVFSKVIIVKKITKPCMIKKKSGENIYFNEGDRKDFIKEVPFINGIKHYIITKKCVEGNIIQIGKHDASNFISCNKGYELKDGKCEQEKQKIFPIKMKKGKFYLINVGGVKTILTLDSFKTSGYIAGAIAPIMDIYGEYEKDKYFQILGTYVLPGGKGTNNGEDGYRGDITIIGFSFKLVSWDSKEYMTLNLKPKGDYIITSKEVDIKKYKLYERIGLTTEKVLEINTLLNKKMDRFKIK